MLSMPCGVHTDLTVCFFKQLSSALMSHGGGGEWQVEALGLSVLSASVKNEDTQTVSEGGASGAGGWRHAHWNKRRAATQQ